MGNPTVDFFSLDVEGAEFPILKTIPWRKVDIKVVQIEVNHLGKIFDGDYQQLKVLMEKNGYRFRYKHKIDVVFEKVN